MLKVHCITVGDYRTNCYIVREEDSKVCCVIDPGSEVSRILSYLNTNGLSVEAVLLTHAHFDHVGAVKTLAAETDCEVYLCAEDLSLPPMFTAGPLYYTHTYDETGTLKLAGMTFRVIRTPGHTPGCVCLIVEDIMFSGDTLFQGTCGRTDLPGSSWQAMTASLKKLAELPGNYRVLPGHGSFTTLDEERKYNPYL